VAIVKTAVVKTLDVRATEKCLVLRCRSKTDPCGVKLDSQQAIYGGKEVCWKDFYQKLQRIAY
jgi:hypothetical protein